jgi:two-component system, cell cycle sensor histidine kinase and response regulator CckA
MSATPADFIPGPCRIALLGSNEVLPNLLIGTGLIEEVRVVATLDELATLLTHFTAHCVFVSDEPGDTALPDRLKEIRARLSRGRFVAVSPHDESEHVVACMRASADDFLSIRDPIQLNARVARVLENLRTHRPIPPVDNRFKTLTDAAPALVWITDAEGNFIHFNRPWLTFTGRTADLELMQGWFDGIHPDDRDRFLIELDNHFSRRQPFRIDFRLRRHDGLYRWITCQGIAHYEDDRFFTGYIGSCLDVSDQHEAETLLAYRAISQAALAGFGRFALGQHTIHEIKQEATRLLCDILQLNFSQVLLFDPPDSDTLVARHTTGFPPDYDHPPMTAGAARESGVDHLSLDEDAAIFPGRETHAEFNIGSGIACTLSNGAQVVGYITCLNIGSRSFGSDAFDFIQAVANTISTVHQRNIAELTLQESEAKLLQSQKMEAVGQLAGGVAHDFNNLLTAVRCYGDMLHDDLTSIAPELKSKTSEILKATARASSLTRQLLAFSRKQVLQPEVLDMNGVISDLQDLVRSLLSESVSLEIKLAGDNACFEADRNQIDQVVLNLCLNARDAMPQGGLLTVSVDLVQLDETTAEKAPPGDYVRLSVSDTGIGMPPDVQARLFQPFFTTKPVGRGTGLGLATCAVIVKNCNGFISFESEQGRGTTFSLLLPRIASPFVDFRLEHEQQIVTGRERILIVEDDEAIRQITFAILDSLGYRVNAVPGSNEALSLFRAEPAPVFDLLLTDVIMPGMDGLTLARRIHDLHTNGPLRTLFMSGYLGSAETVRAVTDYNLPFIEKPFTLDTLARRVRDALDAAPVAMPPAGRA